MVLVLLNPKIQARNREVTGGEMLGLFLCLQVLDFLTTLIAFRVGLGEMSPAVRLMLKSGPVAGMLICKLTALAILGICIWQRKPNVIKRANYFFAGLVVWNLFWICVSVLSGGLS